MKLNSFLAPRSSSMSAKKKYKACMICATLKPINRQESSSDYGDSGDACSVCKSVNSYTTSYKGLITVTNTGGWVEKWQRLEKKGLYAMVVEGTPDEDDLAEWENAGGTYFDRNDSFKM